MKKPVKKAAVIGFPVSHSLSPLMHNTWLARYGLEGVYEKREVLPAHLLETLKKAFEDREWQGFNMTIPHKEEAIKACAYLTPRAKRMGAVNTLYRDKKETGGWCGDNTDGWGCLRSLEEGGVDLKKKGLRVVVVGAGGAARGITDALLEEGQTSLGILNRSYEKALLLSRSLEAFWEDSCVDAYGFERWREGIEDADIVIHTTPMGMVGGPPFPFDFEGAKDSCVVMDCVYRPFFTPCLERARARGLCVVDGLGMLMCQGKPGFEAWFGVEPFVDEALRKRLLEAMEGEGRGGKK